MNLHERAAATEAVVARWRRKPFDWRTTGTCMHLARAQMAALGHRPPVVPRFRSVLGARRALTAMGFATVDALLDSMFVRIAPAARWVGDLVLLEGEPPFDALTIAAGGEKVLGYHEDGAGIVPMPPIAIIGAWRL